MTSGDGNFIERDTSWSPIEPSPIWILKCPVCGFDYNDMVLPTEPMLGWESVETSTERNINGWFGRGDGIIVRMRGECGHNWELCLGFHKGQSFLFAQKEDCFCSICGNGITNEADRHDIGESAFHKHCLRYHLKNEMAECDWRPDADRKVTPNSDWDEEKLRLCSLSARGLWLGMLRLMHAGDSKGFLQQANGKPYSLEQIAGAAGCSVNVIDPLLQELIEAGVIAQTDQGVYFSQRIAKDEAKRRKCSEAGKRGGGNPNFKNAEPPIVAAVQSISPKLSERMKAASLNAQLLDAGLINPNGDK